MTNNPQYTVGHIGQLTTTSDINAASQAKIQVLERPPGGAVVIREGGAWHTCCFCGKPIDKEVPVYHGFISGGIADYRHAACSPRAKTIERPYREEDTGPISYKDARDMLIRFCNSHFNNHGDKARMSIPANPTRDDDIRLSAYIQRSAAEIESLKAEAARANIILGEWNQLQTIFQNHPEIPGDMVPQRVEWLIARVKELEGKMDDVASMAGNTLEESEHRRDERDELKQERDALRSQLEAAKSPPNTPPSVAVKALELVKDYFSIPSSQFYAKNPDIGEHERPDCFVLEKVEQALAAMSAELKPEPVKCPTCEGMSKLVDTAKNVVATAKDFGKETGGPTHLVLFSHIAWKEFLAAIDALTKSPPSPQGSEDAGGEGK